jgi:hypothetical protein
MAWRIALLVGWIGALVGLVVLDDDGVLYAVAGSLLTIVVGALVDRWWVGAAPAVVTVLVIGGFLLLAGGCDVECVKDFGFYTAVGWFLAVFTVPASTALLLGVGLRRVKR